MSPTRYCDSINHHVIASQGGAGKGAAKQTRSYAKVRERLNDDIATMKVHQYYVYIVTNKVNTVLYVGVTSDLEGRIWEHKNKVYKGFTAKYECNKLVYYEEFQWIQDAIAREKQLKGGSRQKKIDLILKDNPGWSDLSAEWYEE